LFTGSARAEGVAARETSQLQPADCLKATLSTVKHCGFIEGGKLLHVLLATSGAIWQA